MHIAYLVQQFPPEIGAGPARVVELSQRWLAAGAAVTVLTGMPSRMVPGLRAGIVATEYRDRLFMRERWEGIDVLRSWSFSSSRTGVARTLANNASFMLTALGHGAARLSAPSVLIASSPPFFPHVAGRLLAALKGVPLVLEVRDLWPDYLVGMGVLRRNSAAARVLFRLERALLHAADAVIVVTDSFARVIEQKGVDPDRILVVPNGVDLTKYYAVKIPPNSAKQKDSFTVGYLGNFGAGQDLSIAVRAAAILQEENVHFVLVGDGPDRARIELMIRDSGLSNITVSGSIPKDQTLECYHSFDVCMVPLAPVPELQDTIPSKIFEIMACERPIVASAGGETHQLVTQSGAGIAVPAGDANGLAGGIRHLRTLSPEVLHGLGARGRAYVAQYYSRDALAQRYLERLQSVVGHGSNGKRPKRAGR